MTRCEVQIARRKHTVTPYYAKALQASEGAATMARFYAGGNHEHLWRDGRAAG